MNIAVKARIRGWLRKVTDLCSPFHFAKAGGKADMPYSISLSQPFIPSATLEGKKHNLKEAASRINDVVIFPGEVFSFWHTVGNPNNPRRFTYGRSLHAGVPVRDYGGGLCQASGIIHHIALIAGLDIIERHNHSVDLYTDETRFAPLGTDATVFYGYKDLRLRNNSESPIGFRLYVEEKELRLELSSSVRLKANELDINVKENDEGVKSVEIRTKSGQKISASTYLPLVH